MRSEILSTVKSKLQEHHDNLTTNVQRWGYYSKYKQHDLRNGGCYGGMEPWAKWDYTGNEAVPMETPATFLVFHGDGPEFTFEELTDFDKRNEKVGASTRGHNQFEGTKRSLKWVKFLLSKKSPWNYLNQFLAVTDAEEINKSGWIFEDGHKMPPKLFYNFAMAQRMLWEQPECAAQWFLLLKKKIDPALALFIASNFFLSPEAKDVNGPYTVYYPWSYLEGGGLDCAYHFIKGKPRTIKNYTGGAEYDDENRAVPNVLPLWQVENDHAQWQAKTHELVSRLDLTLDEIVSIVEDAVQKQEEACAA